MFLLIASIVFVLQVLPFPALQQATVKASVEGVVTRAGSGEPIAGVQVSLRKEGAGPISPIRTDREGRFVFAELDEGSYRITAARNGYAQQEYGQKVPGGNGTPIILAAGQTLTDIVIRLQPAGNVTGHVRDFRGDPVTGFYVQLLRAAYNSRGQRDFQMIGSARTDDRGEYRLYWITPGHYYLRVNSASPSEGMPIGRSRNEVPADAYPTTYYPGTSDMTMASAIDVLPGAELSGIDFALSQHELYRIRGRVIDARTGQPPVWIEVKITSRTPGSAEIPILNPNYDPGKGTFELRNVPQGAYWIFAEVPTDPTAPIEANATPRNLSDIFEVLVRSKPSARAGVDVSGSDVENLSLTLSQGVSLPGLLTVEGQELAAIKDFDQIDVTLESAAPNRYIDFPRRMPPDGRFSLDNVLPGEYRVVVQSPNHDLYLKEARLGLIDLLDERLVISGPIDGRLEIVLSSKGGQIDGRVVDSQLQPVAGIEAVLIPDRFRNRPEVYKTAVTDRNGHFTIRGIVPGEYKVFAWESIERFAWFDSDFLRQSEHQGRAVSVSESSNVRVDVEFIAAPR